MGKGIGIAVIAVIAFVVFILATNPEAGEFFSSEPKPDVRFYDSPVLKEDKIKKGTSTNIMVMARNFEEEAVKNVEVHLSVIEGGNWESHLEFPPVTKLGDIDTELGITSPPKYIEITAKDVSGIDPRFKIQLELFANELSTGNTKTYEITLTE